MPGLSRWCEESTIQIGVLPKEQIHNSEYKRKREEEEEKQEEVLFDAPPLKQKMTEKTSNNSISTNLNVDLNFPLPHMEGRSCLLKVCLNINS